MSFDDNAVLYERYRPGYPEELFDDLVKLSGIPEPGRILEVGPGTGQATLPLARRGFSVLGLEMGERMCRRCRRNLRGFAGVEIRHTRFEDWPLEPEAFDLVLAATAFHWVRPQAGFRRVAHALRPGGSVALVWNFRQVSGTPFLDDLRGVYERLAPHLARPRRPEERIERQRKKIVGSGCFGPVTVTRYPWARDYGAEEYIGLLKTMSDHAILSPGLRRRVFRAVREVFAAHGGVFRRQVVAVLFLARKRQPARGS
jgi:SAM-dependent methyltransferase